MTDEVGKRPERSVWYFYRVKWGYQQEFLMLFRKNHYPVLQEQIKTGRFLSVRTMEPSFHGDGRADWTFVVEITFRDAEALYGPHDEEAIKQRLYPDMDTFRREEQRRFEIVHAHWDVPLSPVIM
jgi:hypothetical protein